MGYYSVVNGEAEITPAIDPSKWLVGYREAALSPQGYFVLTDVPGDEDVVVENGQMKIVGSRAGHTQVAFRWDDSGKYYDFDAECRQLMDWVKSQGSEIHGTFRIDGEESGDISRARFDGTVVHMEQPQLVWPNGDVG